MCIIKIKEIRMNKKIALMGSDECFESIANKLTDTDITFISDDANSDVFCKAKRLNCKCKYVPPEELVKHFASNNYNLIVLTNYTKELSSDVLTLGRFINIHPSLLPSFKGTDAIQRAFVSGVKVSGVTVHWVTSDIDGGKIIAQYPVLIGNSTHFDEFKNEIINMENTLYPIVIDKILKDEVFDFSDLIGGCRDTCGSCTNCRH